LKTKKEPPGRKERQEQRKRKKLGWILATLAPWRFLFSYLHGPL
jgi:hypothetical protein